MPTPWTAAVKAAGRLSIFPTPNVAKGAWGKVFAKAMADVNALSAKHSLGVVFVLATSPPDPSGVGGADVQFDTINGTASFTAFNQSFSDKLSGDAMEGHTNLVKQVFGSNATVAKAFTYVPATPKIGGAKGRLLGDPGRLVIAAHELIHALGLDNSDHSSLSSADLFSSPMEAQQGTAPAADTLHPWGLTAPVMPPIVLAGPTITLIQNNW
ncbi:hypothetical protein [Methylocella sp.]|uniref:hypothetical protein n=1 Tax=Methylocella sp. TaxID=1978226 RepID=UPI0035B1E224